MWLQRVLLVKVGCMLLRKMMKKVCEVYVVDSMPKESIEERFAAKDCKENIEVKKYLQQTQEVATKLQERCCNGE
jgi:hypothetical protein